MQKIFLFCFEIHFFCLFICVYDVRKKHKNKYSNVMC